LANFPEAAAGRRGPRADRAENIKEWSGYRPEVIARIDFLEWNGANHPRHAKFAAQGDGKDTLRDVKET